MTEIELNAKSRPTRAQLSLLVWMRKADKREIERIKAWAAAKPVAHPATIRSREAKVREFSGGSLISYYAEQNKSKKHGKTKGGYANHGWRRAGGTALKHLADAGYADVVGYEAGVVFRLNVLGITFADQQIALEESIHE